MNPPKRILYGKEWRLTQNSPSKEISKTNRSLDRADRDGILHHGVVLL